MGYDNRASLGAMETGSRAALPAWIEFMKAAIAQKPTESFPGDLVPSPIPIQDQKVLPEVPVAAMVKPSANPLAATAPSQ